MHNTISVLGTMVLLGLTMVAPGKRAENSTSKPSQLAQNATPQTSTSNAKQRPLVEDKTDFGPYMSGLKRRLKREWIIPTTDAASSTVVKFKIDSQGVVSAVRIVRSSGDPKIDEAAIQSVLAASPFAPLPLDYKGKNIEISFTFNVNRLREAGSTPN